MKLAAGSLLFVLAAMPAASAVDETSTPPDAATLEAAGATIGEIVIRTGDIFDPETPGENNAVFRTANRLHRTTRAGVIRKALLFHRGDRFSAQALAESERILRATGYLYDAEILPLRYEDGVVDVVVTTRDVWTLEAGVRFSRSGGSNSTDFGLKDSNFLGLGRSISVRRGSNVDRSSTRFGFVDPNLFGRRVQLRLDHADNSDGRLEQFDLERPFYALDSRWATGVRFRTDDREDSLYAAGAVVEVFGHRQQTVEAYGGWSRGLVNGRVRRFSAGFTTIADRFDPVPGTVAAEAVPLDRTLSYPWTEMSVVEDRFIEARDMNKLHRTEDFNLGRQFRLRLGVADPAFGADRTQGVVEAAFDAGFSPGDRQVLLLGAHGSGRFGSGGGDDVLAGVSAQYFLRDIGEDILYIRLSGDAAYRLNPERQLLLGGDTGLRGYPLRYLDGDRRLLLTVEQRIFTDWHPFRLFRVGWAAFADVGAAWFSGAGADERLWRRDVGVGLRLGSSRSAHGSLIHIDLALPLDGDASISRTQFLVTTSETF